MTDLLPQLLPDEIFRYLLVFARVGTAMVILPGIGEVFISMRFRLLLGLTITFIMTPPVASLLPPLPATVSEMFIVVGGEMIYGAFIGTFARFLVTALAMGGTYISFLSGFAAAQLFNPLLGSQGALTAAFLSLTGMLLIFATDTHHVMFMAIADSYTFFTPGSVPEFGDMANVFAQLLSKSFVLAIQIASPFIVIALVFYTGLGLMARLMPQMPVFFVALPLQILLGLFVLMLTVAAILTWFIDYFQDQMSNFAAPF